jgi:hypothetical protein
LECGSRLLCWDNSALSLLPLERFCLDYTFTPGVSRQTLGTVGRKFQGGLLEFLGFMLSPLSWWNDWFVNIPIALTGGWVAAWFYQPAFLPAVIFTYWLTNIAGFVLMHKGAQKFVGNKDKPYTRRNLVHDVCVSLVYTVIIITLVKLDVFGPFNVYSLEKFSPAR